MRIHEDSFDVEDAPVISKVDLKNFRVSNDNDRENEL